MSYFVTEAYILITSAVVVVWPIRFIKHVLSSVWAPQNYDEFQ